MQYQGGKSRLARRFAPILQAALDKAGGRFIEPFVGGFNVIQHLRIQQGDAVASDTAAGLIGMYKALQAGWRPPTEVSEATYRQARLLGCHCPDCTFMSYGCSWGGKRWGGFARNKSQLDYCAASRASLLRKLPAIQATLFASRDYRQTAVAPDDVVYCDPPYAGTTGYGYEFKHDLFWQWCRSLAESGASVFVSEFQAPAGCEIVWEWERPISLGIRSKQRHRTERLYRVWPAKNQECAGP